MRSRRTKIPAEEKVRIVLSVLAGEMTGAEAARRHGVSEMSVSKWKTRFLEAGASSLEEIHAGPDGQAGTPEQRRMRMENEQLKLALAEATVQLRIWQRGAQYVDEVPSQTSRP
jgi:transposase-like protein